MWHIYRNAAGLFEFAYISKGRYIVGTKQGYERIGKARKALAHIIWQSNENGSSHNNVQDDTDQKVSIRGWLDADGVHHLTGEKPVKRYTGQENKSK